MKLMVTLEQRFSQTPDGMVWTQTAFPYHFWQRYLEVFESVKVIARVLAVSEVQTDWIRADGEGVKVVALPYYVGLRGYLGSVRNLTQIVRQLMSKDDAVIFRVPSPIAAAALPTITQCKEPYGVEVVGDPYDVFAPGAIRHPMRPFFRWWFTRQLHHIVAGACAAAYVTEQTLQRRYPPAPNAFSCNYSDVELPEDSLFVAPRPPNQLSTCFNLVTVGSLEQLYKGTDILLKAVHICVSDGLDIRLTIIGDGKHRHELEELATSLGVGEHVRFLGPLPAGDAVREQLDAADLFVLPSRTEGLPRAMIEAMARGLPCIGSTAGGIPELLPPEDMITPGDASALAHKIHEVITQPERMARMSACNLDKARRYGEPILRERRLAFYRHLKAETEAWRRTGL